MKKKKQLKPEVIIISKSMNNEEEQMISNKWTLLFEICSCYKYGKYIVYFEVNFRNPNQQSFELIHFHKQTF